MIGVWQGVLRRWYSKTQADTDVVSVATNRAGLDLIAESGQVAKELTRRSAPWADETRDSGLMADRLAGIVVYAMILADYEDFDLENAVRHRIDRMLQGPS